MDKKDTIEKLVREAHDKDIFTGAWLLAENGEIVSKGAIGYRDKENTLPVTEDSIFELASVSKQFTAAAIMLLIKRGKLTLDDELTSFFPENPYPGITIRHLLDHTSGLPDHEEWAIETMKDFTEIPDNSLSVRFLKECGLAPLFAPGEKYEYSNTAYCLLAEIVEQVSGVTFEDFMRKEIFEPAGMFSTQVGHIRVDGIPFENFARGLVFHDGKFEIPDEVEEYRYVILLDGESGDGFVYSNLPDMLRWDRAFREEKIFSKEDQKIMFTPSRPKDRSTGYGEKNELGYNFGWSIVDDPAAGRIACHSGGWPGYITWYERGLDKDYVLVLLCCRTPDEMKDLVSLYGNVQLTARGRELKSSETE